MGVEAAKQSSIKHSKPDSSYEDLLTAVVIGLWEDKDKFTGQAEIPRCTEDVDRVYG